jgi:hypothetical protein
MSAQPPAASQSQLPKGMPMFIRRILVQSAVLGFWSAAALAQKIPPSSPQPALHEFPLTLQQSIESGKAKIGTKVQAKLATATLFQGTVIPRNALFSGVVVESDAKTAKERAKLAIRMETAEWKDHSTSLKAYLIPVYYTATTQAVPSLPNGSPDPSSRTLNGEQANSPMQRPSPSTDSQMSQTAIPDSPSTLNRPVPMKNVTLALADEGGAALVSEHANIKLYKLTTYVFAAGEAPIQ